MTLINRPLPARQADRPSRPRRPSSIPCCSKFPRHSDEQITKHTCYERRTADTRRVPLRHDSRQCPTQSARCTTHRTYGPNTQERKAHVADSILINAGALVTTCHLSPDRTSQCVRLPFPSLCMLRAQPTWSIHASTAELLSYCVCRRKRRRRPSASGSQPEIDSETESVARHFWPGRVSRPRRAAWPRPETRHRHANA